MASLVKRGDSPSWWVSFLDKDGNRKFRSTGYRRDDDRQTKLARVLEAELSAQEFQRQAPTAEAWANWVPDFLPRHSKGRTLDRYTSAWREVYTYLREKEVRTPRDLTYQHALGFIKWRTAQKRRGGKNIKLNTALNDIKVMRLVVRQGIRLFGLNMVNPCDKLGVEKEDCAEKPEMTDAHIAAIRAALAVYETEPPERAEMMRRSFEIALHTGCRISDTRIAFDDIDFARGTLTFAKPKGGRKRAFTIPLPSGLVPLLRRIAATGESHTVVFHGKPGKPPMTGKEWWDFFQAHFPGSGFCFHCTRVTFVTRLARAGVPVSAAMKLVNHASILIHRIYQRLGVEDVRQWTDAVRIPAAQPQPPEGAAPGDVATPAPP